MNTEELAMELEKTIQKSKDQSKYFSQEIQRLKCEKIKIEKEFDNRIELLKKELLDSLGFEESVETNFFIISKSYPNIKSQTTYKLEFPTNKKSSERFIQYLQKYDTGLLKEDIIYKPIQKNIKQLIIDEIFHISDNGTLVDDNGEIVPDVKVSIKEIEPKVKVKKTKFNKNKHHELNN